VERKPPGTNQIAALVVGNALEWYDFIVYGYLTITISKLFFPSTSDWMPVLGTLAIFAVSFVVRPFGGMIIGTLADHFGRRKVLLGTIAAMMFATGVVAVTPTYSSVGLAAPLIILAARLLHGLSVGGEFASATALLVESAPDNRRGLYGAWQFSGQGAAILLSGLIGTLITSWLTSAEMESWGWRLPFVIGLAIGPVGMYMRARLGDSGEFLEARKRDVQTIYSPIVRTFADHKARILVGLGLVVGGTVSIYVLFVFMPTYVVRTLGLEPRSSFIAPAVAGLVLTVACPVMGYLSDRIGRKAVMACSAGALLCALYPTFQWLQVEPTVMKLVVAEVAFGLCVSAYLGALGAAMVELFPVLVRATAMSIAYNSGVALFGGAAPLIVAALIAKTGDPLAPAYYVMAGLCIALVAIAFTPSWVSEHKALTLRSTQD
jgi:MHS family proline/betaine transporter-like MFS transporter